MTISRLTFRVAVLILMLTAFLVSYVCLRNGFFWFWITGALICAGCGSFLISDGSIDE